MFKGKAMWNAIIIIGIIMIIIGLIGGGYALKSFEFFGFKFSKGEILESQSQLHNGNGDNINRDKIVNNYAANESNKLIISEVLSKTVSDNHGYNYEVKFDSTKNEQFNLIKISIQIVSGEGIFTGTSGYSIYSIHQKNISNDGKVLKYEISMKPGTKPVIGFFISKPSTIEISGNYNLETEQFILE